MYLSLDSEICVDLNSDVVIVAEKADDGILVDRTQSLRRAYRSRDLPEDV